MNPRHTASNRRILIVDDNPSIHADFRKILGGPGPTASALAQASADLFGETPAQRPPADFDLTTASQGEEGLAAVRDALQSGKPFALAFVDVRMPPGWDGIETTRRIWETDPDLQIVLCTAYSDYSWNQIGERLGDTDRLLILKKPFDAVEVLQLASTMTEKWRLHQLSKREFQNLEQIVGARTCELQAANEKLQTNIAEHQRTVQTLRTTQEKLGHFLAKSPAVLYSLRFEAGQFRPAWVSDNVVTIIPGEVPEWYRQTPGLEYVEEADRPSVEAGLNLLKQRGTLTLEYRVRHNGGAPRWVRDDRKLLRDDTGRPTEILGCWTDITEQRLLQDQLRQAQKMESVGQLAGGVAHDFNNLLMVIQGYVEMLLATEQLRNPAAETLRQVYAAADKAGHLTRQLLAFSRKQMMQPEEVDLNELIGTSTKLLARTLEEHIKVEARCTRGLPSVFADRGMMDQVIMNLAVNARDAMPGGGELVFSTEVQHLEQAQLARRPDARPGTFVCLSVQDTGSGIAPEHLSHLFEPFFTTKEVGKGTGLGLATVYGIVKQHEGWIEVDSRVGRGTTFHVFLPAASAPVESGPLAAPSSPVRGRGENILLVEDEPSVRGLIRTSLQRYGYRVQTAASGADALKNWLARLNEVDLLLTDVVMPEGVSGWDLAWQFQERKPALKVIFMSGYNEHLTEIEAEPVIENGNQFLRKPFKPQQLAEVVRSCLDAEGRTLVPTA